MGLGILIGLVIGFVFNLWIMHSYKKVLMMKAKDKTTEHIYGNFYYVVEEKEYIDLVLKKYKGE